MEIVRLSSKPYYLTKNLIGQTRKINTKITRIDLIKNLIAFFFQLMARQM